jgi:hypothetical protein
MSVGHDFTSMELWFILGALFLTLLAGVVLYPGLKKALSDPPEEKQ